MFSVRQWNKNQTLLKKTIKKESSFDKAKKLLLKQHASLHCSTVLKVKEGNYEDELWKNLDEKVARQSLNKKKRTILYGIWHATRIEDMTMSILVSKDKQVYTKGNWQKKIKAPFSHTGNSLLPSDILKFSSKIDIKALRAYRKAVGRNTQKIIKSLSYEDLKRKVSQEGLDQILKEKAVLKEKKSFWLIDFWGRKTIEGLLFMPATRHILVHLNESFEAKKKGV